MKNVDLYTDYYVNWCTVLVLDWVALFDFMISAKHNRMAASRRRLINALKRTPAWYSSTSNHELVRKTRPNRDFVRAVYTLGQSRQNCRNILRCPSLDFGPHPYSPDRLLKEKVSD